MSLEISSLKFSRMVWWKQNIASEYMVLLQVVVVYDRGTTKFRWLQILPQILAAAQQLALQVEKLAIFVFKNALQASKGIVRIAAKCFVFHVLQILEPDLMYRILLSARIAGRILCRISSIYSMSMMSSYFRFALLACLFACLLLLFNFNLIFEFSLSSVLLI